MNIGKHWFRNTLFIVTFALSSMAEAASVTIQFTGTIDTVSANAAGFLNIGDNFSGTYTYDTTVADTASPTDTGRYTNALTAVSISVGNFSFSKGIDQTPDPGTDSITIGDNVFPPQNVDFYGLNASEFSGQSIGSYAANQLSFQMALIDGDGTIFTDDTLLTNAPDLAAFQSGHQYDSSFLSLLLNDNGQASFFVEAQLLSITAVPVPASAWLFGSGLISLFGMARHKRTLN